MCFAYATLPSNYQTDLGRQEELKKNWTFQALDFEVDFAVELYTSMFYIYIYIFICVYIYIYMSQNDIILKSS